MSDDDLPEAALKRLADAIEKQTRDMMLGGTSVAPEHAQEPPAITADTLRQWGNLIREAKKHNITFIVDQCHIGPIVHHDTPTEGKVIECSFPQAVAIHAKWPLVFVKAISTERAEFRPASQFDTFALPLFAPPYELPPETDEH